jgi:hypothetical protein
MRFRLLCLLLLLPRILSAQTAGEWLLHPTISSATLVMERYSVQDANFRTSALSMLSAGFGSAGDGFRFNLSYDVLGARFMTCEAVWQPLQQIGIRAGIQKMPFLAETTFSPVSLGMIGYSQAVSALGGYSSDVTGINSRSRDVGISLSGSLWPQDGYSLLQYCVGVYNGNGYSFRDNNAAKDLQGRLIFQPARNLKISLGGMYGHYTPADAAGNAAPAARHRISAGIWFDNGKWFVRSENIYGITGALRSDGIMALAGFQFLSRLQLTARVDRFQRDLSDTRSAITRADICFSHLLTESGDISYKIQYGHTFYADPSLPGKDAITLCLSFSFRKRI